MNFFSYVIRVFLAGCYTAFNIALLYVHARISGSGVFFGYAKRWARMLLRLTGTQLRVLHFGAMPEGNCTCVFVCNHISLLDAPSLITALPENVRFMYKIEIEKVPLFGGMLARSPFIAINRGDSREAAASFYQAVREIEAGGSVLLFPEGTWSTDGTILPFKRGALLLALRSGKPVVPVAIWGTQRALPPDSLRFRGGQVAVAIGTPVSISASTSKADEQIITAEIRRQMETMLEHLKNIGNSSNAE